MIVRSTKREKERERERKRDRAKTYGGISAFTLDIVRDARRPLTSIVFEITEASASLWIAIAVFIIWLTPSLIASIMGLTQSQNTN